MIAIEIAGVVSIALWLIIDIITLVDDYRRRKLERRRAMDARRRRNESIVAIRLECGAELVRVDETAKEEIAACVPHEWPQPLEVGELFISCGNGCKKAATCPVARRLLDPSLGHYVTAEDGFKLVKSRKFFADGSAVFSLVVIPDGEHLVFHGAKIRFKGDGRCYVRTSPLRDPAKRADERAADKNESAGDLERLMANHSSDVIKEQVAKK